MKLWLLRVSKVNENFSGVCLFVPRIHYMKQPWCVSMFECVCVCVCVCVCTFVHV